MARRSSKSGTPLNARQQELAARENQLREQMDKLQRMIEEAPRKAEEKTRQRREELFARASEEGSRLDVSIGMRDLRHADEGRPSGGERRGSLRKERREGRIIFLVLVIALAAVVLWLITHLRF
ncbi:MAG: hypothetical protein ABI883_06135 [Chthoniobacterales bacterium]